MVKPLCFSSFQQSLMPPSPSRTGLGLVAVLMRARGACANTDRSPDKGLLARSNVSSWGVTFLQQVVWYAQPCHLWMFSTIFNPGAHLRWAGNSPLNVLSERFSVFNFAHVSNLRQNGELCLLHNKEPPPRAE